MKLNLILTGINGAGSLILAGLFFRWLHRVILVHQRFREDSAPMRVLSGNSSPNPVDRLKKRRTQLLIIPGPSQKNPDR